MAYDQNKNKSFMYMTTV